MKWFVAFTLVISFLLLLSMPVSVTETTEPLSAQSPVVAASSTDPFEASFLDSLNEVRKARSSQPVSYSQSLGTIADTRLSDMIENQYYAHSHPITGKNFSTLLPAGSGFACENLLLSPSTDPKVVLSEWTASPSHEQCLHQSQVKFASVKK